MCNIHFQGIFRQHTLKKPFEFVKTSTRHSCGTRISSIFSVVKVVRVWKVGSSTNVIHWTPELARRLPESVSSGFYGLRAFFHTLSYTLWWFIIMKVSWKKQLKGVAVEKDTFEWYTLLCEEKQSHTSNVVKALLIYDVMFVCEHFDILRLLCIDLD